VRLVKPEDKNEIDFIKENSEGIEIVRRVVDGQETEIYNRKKEAKNG
jgi:hypothetical protein